MKRFTALSYLVFTFSLLLALLLPQTASAAFNKNLIISDSVFDKKGSMSAAGIDAFLNSFPSSCISTNNGFQAKNPSGYSPSTGYQYGNYVSAGTVIYSAAQAYDINPQVILTTLQKEQSLVSGTAGCSKLRYTGAMGYGCPDGGSSYNYSNVSLYKKNGTVVSSVSGTCVNSVTKAGFAQQVIRGAWLLKFGQQRSKGRVTWAIIRGNWDNSDDLESCYSGPMTRGTWQRCPSGSAVYYDGYKTIDSSSAFMGSGATAAMYWYTPHYHGNQVFVSTFESWFGPTRYTGPDVPVTGDWNGDGTDTTGVKRGNQYLLDNDNDGVADVTLEYGKDGDIPLVGDWDGNGTDTISVRRGNLYFINNSNSNPVTVTSFTYGNPSTIGMTGDWDGDGDDTIALRMGSTYYISNTLDSGSNFKYTYGNPRMTSIEGDWNGDGIDTISGKIGNVYYINNRLASGSNFKFAYGDAKDIPVSGDWDDDNDDTISLNRGSVFFINNDLAGGSDFKVYIAN